MKNPLPRTTEKKGISFEYPIQSTFKLPASISAIPARFDEVISKRRSTRNFSGITLQQLSDILWYTAKVKKTFVQDNGYILTHRGTPSAGARHPIDIVIYNPKIFNNEHFYYYNPFEHSLNQLTNPNTQPLTQHINQIVPIGDGTLIWFVVHQQRTAAKYDHPESLIMRDSGALLNSIQLTATALTLNSCPIGSLGEPFISDFFDNADIYGAGGIIIG
jgi:SagB-type dehydrogenase family enzyme